MTLQKIYPEFIETISLNTNPKRNYTSSSSGVTGDLYVFPRRILREKQIKLTSSSSVFTEQTDLNDYLDSAKNSARVSSSNYNTLNSFLTAVNNQPTNPNKQQKVLIYREVPGFDIDKAQQLKKNLQKVLIPFYKPESTTFDFSYNNFNSLNFFRSSGTPTSSVLLYPNLITVGSDSTITGRFIPPTGFSFDLWVKPGYTNTKAATIFHLSSVFALSVLTGSLKNERDEPLGYRLLLQTSASCDTSPSTINLSSLPTGSFLSDNNCLLKNHWHHVSIRWGGLAVNNGTGSFYVDGNNKGNFVISSSTIVPLSFSPGRDNPNVLCIGNFYEGTNSGSASTGKFFTSTIATREGIEQLTVDTGFAPSSYFFDHTFSGELSELKIYNRYITDSEIRFLQTNSPLPSTQGLIFYLPPFFTYESPTRTFHAANGGVLISPFQTEDGTTNTPFNKDLAYGLGGHYINLENNTREMVNGIYPRLWELTGSLLLNSLNNPMTANEILYSTGSVKKASLTVLPSDNGNYFPNYDWFSSLNKTRFVNDFGSQDLSRITLNDILPSRTEAYNNLSGSLASDLVGSRPENISASITNNQAYTLQQRTGDSSSRQVVMFNISNLFYGDKIKPNSLTIVDTDLSGSDGIVRITLKDDGCGNLYRADSSGSLGHATWNSVGNVFYNEGIVLIKHPSLYFFGKNEFRMTFQGERNVHVLSLNLFLAPYQFTSSSNPSFVELSSSISTNINEEDRKFVYVTNVNIHDDNLNVIAKTSFAQPYKLKYSDKALVKVKLDF